MKYQNCVPHWHDWWHVITMRILDFVFLLWFAIIELHMPACRFSHGYWYDSSVWACQYGVVITSVKFIFWMKLLSLQAQYHSITWTRSLPIGGTKFRVHVLTSTWTRHSVNATWRYSMSVWRQCQVRARRTNSLCSYDVFVCVVQHSGLLTASHFISRHFGPKTGFHFTITTSCESVCGPKCHVLSLWSNGKNNFGLGCFLSHTVMMPNWILIYK